MLTNPELTDYNFGMSIQLGDYELPEHVSYSAFSTYVDCGYQYYLGRLLQVPEAPSVWSVGGSAFHTATEIWDLEHADDAR
jgi:ATP-dependent helicase/DNAse subunit B